MSGFDVRVHFLHGTDTTTATTLEAIMAAIDEMRASLARLNAATTNIAADIQRLKDKISTSMSAADVAEVTVGLGNVATLLEAVANDPTNPDPAV